MLMAISSIAAAFGSAIGSQSFRER